MRPRGRTGRGAGWIAAAVLAAWSVSGCHSTRVPEGLIAVSPYPDRDVLAGAVTNEARPMELSEAVAYALSTSPKISALRASVHRAAGNAAEATTPKSPEFRFGFGREDEDTRGWGRETETGSSLRTGSETDFARETSAETGSFERRQWGWLEETSTRERDTVTDTQGAQTSRKSSRYTSSAYTTDIGDQSEDSLQLRLRYYPPNPWLLAAAGGAARAARWMNQAEMVEEEHTLICDAVEAAVEIAYGERILRVREAFAKSCRALHDDVRRAAEEGNLPRTDFLDARLRLASAEAEREQAADRLATWRQKFRASTGVDPERVTLHTVEPGAVFPMKAAEEAAGVSALAPGLARQRPDMLAAYWNRLRHEQEWREARAAGYPWFDYVEVSYSRWDVLDHRQRTVEKSRQETGVTSQSATQSQSRRETQEERTSNGEVETGTSESTAWETGSSSGTEYETGTGFSTESSSGSSDGDEWWVGVSVAIPIFEWMSRQKGERYRALVEARRGYEAGLARAEREIRMAGQVLQKSLAEYGTIRRSFEEDRREIERLAETSETMGLAGRLEALRLRERSTEIAILALGRAMGVALDELHLCRVTGLAPGQPVPPVAAAEGRDGDGKAAGPR